MCVCVGVYVRVCMCTHDICTYPGDYDEDGLITVNDLLALLSFFGCESCPEQDLTGDDVVTVQDILVWLGLFG